MTGSAAVLPKNTRGLGSRLVFSRGVGSKDCLRRPDTKLCARDGDGWLGEGRGSEDGLEGESEGGGSGARTVCTSGLGGLGREFLAGSGARTVCGRFYCLWTAGCEDGLWMGRG